MNETIKVLFVNTGVVPVSTQKVEMEPETVKSGILDGINKMGNRAHALVKFKDRYYVCEHSEQSGTSQEYKRREVKYHPFMTELV